MSPESQLVQNQKSQRDYYGRIIQQEAGWISGDAVVTLRRALETEIGRIEYTHSPVCVEDHPHA